MLLEPGRPVLVSGRHFDFQSMADLGKPSKRPIDAIGHAHGQIGNAEIFLHLFRQSKTQLIPHYQVQRRRRCLHDIGPTASSAGHGSHRKPDMLQHISNFHRIFATSQMSPRKAQHVHREILFFSRLHFLLHPKGGRRKAGLVAAFETAAVHGIDRPGKMELICDALGVVAHQADAAIADDEDPVRLRIGFDVVEAGLQILFRAIDQRIRPRLGAEKSFAGHGILIVHIFHGVEIAPQRAVDERKAPRYGIEKRRRTGQSAGAAVVARCFPLTR